MTVNRASGRGRSPHPGPTPWCTRSRGGCRPAAENERSGQGAPGRRTATWRRRRGRGRHQLPPGDACEAARRSIDEPARFVVAVNEDWSSPSLADRDVVTATSHPRSGRPPARRDRRTRSLRRTKRGHPALGRARASAIDEGSPGARLVEAVGALEARHRVPDERGERLIALEKEATVGIVLIMLTFRCGDGRAR